MRSTWIVPLLALAPLLAPACTNDEVGIDACRSIEDARCDKLAQCDPSFVATYGSTDSCHSFYYVQCGRGLADGVTNPSGAQLNACVSEIQNAPCPDLTDPTAVARDPAHDPTQAPACAFLNPPPATDGATDTTADAADADTDADVDVDDTTPADTSPPPDTTPPPDTSPPPDTTPEPDAVDASDASDAE